MGFIKKIFSLLFMLILVGLGTGLLLFSGDIITLDQLVNFFSFAQSSFNSQIALGVMGAVLAITGLILPYRVLKNIPRKKFISFKNPDGEVVISIAAIEEYIKKIAKGMAEISDIKSKVIFNRRGLSVFCDVTIGSGANIPEITEKVQLGVKTKIQSMLGEEEKINVIVHISKIIGELAQGTTAGPEEPSASEIPYR